jgi:hypothetical protein
MEASYNNGTAFFNIESSDFQSAIYVQKSVNKLINNDVISFTITEELGKLTSGNLQLRDDKDVYSRIFRNGTKFDISWGYKMWNQDIKTLGINSLLPRGVRQGLKCVVVTPSGGGDEQGSKTYAVSFLATEALKKSMPRVYASGIRGDVVADAFHNMEVDEYVIDFPTKNQRLNSLNSVRQGESTFAFLREIALEWGAYVLIGHKPNGKKIGLFLDWNKTNSVSSRKFIDSIIGISSKEEKEFYYNSGSMSNVKSFTWSQNIGENGGGDDVQVQLVSGKVVTTRRVMEAQKVTLWRLDEVKLQTHIDGLKTTEEKTQFIEWVRNTQTFDEVKDFFIRTPTTTAPQGEGFTITMPCHGDPFLTVMLSCKFKNGFPAPLSIPKDGITEFNIKRATHNFMKGEYTTDIEIVDSYNLTGSHVLIEAGDITPK